MTNTVELDKTSAKNTERLVDLLGGILLSNGPVDDLLQEFISSYNALPTPARQHLFELMLRHMEVKKHDVVGPIGRILGFDGSDHAAWTRLLTDLRRQLMSPRMEAFKRFTRVAGGIKFLLDLRGDVLAAKRASALDLDPLDEELAHLFESWFQHGFLFMEEISRDSSLRQIRFLKDHDMVHPMESLEEIWHRLGRDRRCFTLYHRAMPEEPIVFIEAALTRGIPQSIHEILRQDEERGQRPGKPDTAVFYSINNTQDGLTGLGLGKVLISNVVESVIKSDTAIKKFCTISPIPGFWPHYLRSILQGKPGHFAMTTKKLLAYFPEKTQAALRARHAELTGRKVENPAALLVEILQNHQWIEDPTYRRLLRWPLKAVTYYYLTKEKNKQGKPLNPVAGFHMGNGATVSIVNVRFAANRSERGLEDSCGMMVNYLYSPTSPRQNGSMWRSLLGHWVS